MTVDELEYQMQRASEDRLEKANDWLFHEEFDAELVEQHDIVSTLEAPTLAGPYCGCSTCVVREVLDAAWPFMYRLAHAEGIEQPDLP